MVSPLPADCMHHVTTGAGVTAGSQVGTHQQGVVVIPVKQGIPTVLGQHC